MRDLTPNEKPPSKRRSYCDEMSDIDENAETEEIDDQSLRLSDVEQVSFFWCHVRI